jgi:hypothetical protein
MKVISKIVLLLRPSLVSVVGCEWKGSAENAGKKIDMMTEKERLWTGTS